MKNESGFTIIEVLIVITLIVVIIGMALFTDTAWYQRRSLSQEQVTIVSALEKARSDAMNNIDDQAHGLHIQHDPRAYILFEGDMYSGDNPTNESITASANIILLPSTDTNIIFNQLSGDCVTCSSDIDLTLSDGGMLDTIIISPDGQIQW